MLAFNMETKEIIFLKEYWRADVDSMEKEGEIYVLLEAKDVPNIAPFGKGNNVHHHTYTEKCEVGMLVGGYGALQPIQDVSGRHHSAFDFIQVLTGVCESDCQCHDK
jgi:hypothetical protein